MSIPFRSLVLLSAVAGAAACSPGTPSMACAPWGTAEEVAARPSPFDSVEASAGDVRLKLCYSRPSARGRVVFGNLVPFDTLWRTGANEATVLHTSGPVSIAGVDVSGGEYSIYTVPRHDGWQLVVNGATGQWGLTEDAVGARGNRFPNAYTDDVRAQEIARTPIRTDSVAYTETLTAAFAQTSTDSLELRIDWEETRVVIPIAVRRER